MKLFTYAICMCMSTTHVGLLDMVKSHVHACTHEHTCIHKTCVHLHTYVHADKDIPHNNAHITDVCACAYMSYTHVFTYTKDETYMRFTHTHTYACTHSYR